MKKAQESGDKDFVLPPPCPRQVCSSQTLFYAFDRKACAFVSNHLCIWFAGAVL